MALHGSFQSNAFYQIKKYCSYPELPCFEILKKLTFRHLHDVLKLQFCDFPKMVVFYLLNISYPTFFVQRLMWPGILLEQALTSIYIYYSYSLISNLNLC